jgi:hypothetical protein
MASFGQLIFMAIVLGFWCALTQVPAVLVITFTHRNFSILTSVPYWIANGASALPSILGLAIFLGIYPLLKAPGEGAIAGLFFVFGGALMMSVGAARFAYQYPEIEQSVFWDSFKVGLAPYLIAIVLYALIFVLALANAYWRGEGAGK